MHVWVSRVYAAPRRTSTDGSAGSLRGITPSARPSVSSVRRLTPPEQTMLLQILSIFIGATRGSAEGTALLDYFPVLTIWILSLLSASLLLRSALIIQTLYVGAPAPFYIFAYAIPLADYSAVHTSGVG